MRTARRYSYLAAFARDQGFDAVTADAVQSWVKAGLLPRTIPHHLGFGVKVSSEPVGVGRQLLALCGYRFTRGHRNLDYVGLLMWLDGFDVHLDTVRGGLARIARLPEELVRLTRQRSDAVDPTSPDADIDAAVVAAIERGIAQFGAGGVDEFELAGGLATFLKLTLNRGPIPRADLDDLRAMGRMIGLDRAARDHPAGVSPWLTEPPTEALRKAAQGLSPEVAVTKLLRASRDELEEARAAAQRLAAVFAEFQRLATLSGDPGYAGLELVGGVSADPEGRALIALAALLEPTGAKELVDGIAFEPHSG